MFCTSGHALEKIWRTYVELFERVLDQMQQSLQVHKVTLLRSVGNDGINTLTMDNLPLNVVVSRWNIKSQAWVVPLICVQTIPELLSPRKTHPRVVSPGTNLQTLDSKKHYDEYGNQYFALPEIYAKAHIIHARSA